jgi:uncharacterized protein (TIGR02466 family)
MSGKPISLFPTLLYQGQLAGAVALNRRLMQDIENFSKQDRMGVEWSKQNYRGGYTSYASLSDMHHRSPAFSDFADRLQTEAETYAKSLCWELRGMRLEMTACWMNIMPRHTYHTLHMHPHSVLSGAYYVTSPPGSVSLKIEDPRMPYYMNAPVKTSRGEKLYYEVKPKPGTFVLFESWVRHEVPPNESSTPRVSISFNFSLTAEDEG